MGTPRNGGSFLLSRGSLAEDNIVGELREQIESLQKRIKELEGDDQTSIVSQIAKERDELEEKLRYIQDESKNLREEYDRAQEAQQEADSKLFEIQLKSKQAQQKYEQQIKQTKDKLEEVCF